MSILSTDSPDWLSRLFQGLAGMLGLYAVLRFLPRVLKNMIRRFLFGVVGEILLVALGIFLTRRSAGGSSPPSESASGEQRASRRE